MYTKAKLLIQKMKWLALSLEIWIRLKITSGLKLTGLVSRPSLVSLPMGEILSRG